MLRLEAYDDTLTSASVNTCLIYPGHSNGRKFKGVLAKGQDAFVAMTIKLDSSIDPNHVVFNEWVFDMLQIERKHVVSMEPIEAEQVLPAKVCLHFVAFQSMKDWDDVNCYGPLHLPYVWYTCWPEELNQSFIERAVVLLLMGSVLYEGATIAVRHLDVMLVRHGTHIFNYHLDHSSSLCVFLDVSS